MKSGKLEEYVLLIEENRNKALEILEELKKRRQ